MGQPFGGFPEPLRTKALRDRRKLDQRPGLYLEPLDLSAIKNQIREKFGSATESDVASYAMYPKVFEDYKKFVQKFGDLSVLPTRFFLARPEIGEEFHVELEKGKVLILKLLAIGPLSEQTGQREVFYEVNGEVRVVSADDNKASVDNTARPKADVGDSSQVGAPMSGVVVEIRVHDGHDVKKGDPVAVLSAMKMVSLFLFFKKKKKKLTRAGNGDLGTAQRQGIRTVGQGGRLGGWTGSYLQDCEAVIVIT